LRIRQYNFIISGVEAGVNAVLSGIGSLLNLAISAFNAYIQAVTDGTNFATVTRAKSRPA